MPQWQRENGARNEPCPDSELLFAYAEDQVSLFVRDAIAGHVQRCSQCREICERLAQFSKANVPAPDAEWVNAEKRLDNWMEGFLQGEASKARPSFKIEPPEPAARWAHLSLPALSWALSAAAVVIVGVLGLVFIRRGPTSPAPVQIAQMQATPRQAQPSLPQEQPANLGRPPAESPAPKNASAGGANLPQPTQKPQLAGTKNEPLKTIRSGISAEATSLRAAQPTPASRDFGKGNADTSRAALTPVPPKPGAEMEPPIGGEGRVGVTQTAHAGSPPKPGNELEAPKAGKNGAGTSQMAQASLPPSRDVEAAPEKAYVAPVGTGGKEMSAAPAALAREENRPPLPARPVVDDLTTLKFEAGTRLWIRLDRPLPEDGVFTFQGSVMPPIAPSGSNLLKPGTGVNGSGTMKAGEVTNILMTDVVIKGVHYKLQGMAGGVNKNTAGSGWALPFYEGKVLEMQLTADSVYEKPSGGGAWSGHNVAAQRAPTARAGGMPATGAGQRSNQAGPAASPKQAAPPQPPPPRN